MKRRLFSLSPALVAALVFCAIEVRGADGWDVAQLDALLESQTGEVVQAGDMLFRRETLEAWRSALVRGGGTPQGGGGAQAAAASGSAPLWTDGEVFYTFNANVSAIHRRAFLDAAAEWEAFADVRFIERTTQPNYIKVNDGGPGLAGGNSFVGMVGGEQALNIGSTSWNRGTLCHEIGHALGLVHEHQRSDRDSFVTVQTANILAGAEGNFVKLPSSNNTGAYDFLSVMHYRRDTFSTNPGVLDTITPLAAFAQFGDVMGVSFPRVLSSGDRAGMAALYGPPPVPPSAVVTNTRDSGSGSLRAAIYHAADHPGTTVTFQIPAGDAGFAGGVFTIRPTDALPGPADGTTIDATTQTAFTGNTNPAGPEVALSGLVVPATDQQFDGLVLADAGCTVRGLIVHQFVRHGVRFTGAGSTGNKLCGCHIGTDAAGAAAEPNALSGVLIEKGAHGNTVGGAGAGDGNVISGNTDRGVLMVDAGTTANVVTGNVIGLSAGGGAVLPNGDEGVAIFANAGGNTIGPGNVISGNTRQGIIVADAAGTVIAGNRIGTNPAGTVARGNGFAGIAVFDAAAGTVIGPGNVISGNGSQGITISEAGTDGTVVTGNFIGTNAAGSAAIGNAFAGVSVFGGAEDTVIGPGNVISGNANQGVTVSDAGTDGTRVIGNFIGTDSAGTAAVPNVFSGVAVFNGAKDTEIGGSTPGAGNVISGNDGSGVALSGAGTTGTVIAGNFIGTNAAGTAALANEGSGVDIFLGASGALIGGGPGARNVIAGNTQWGVLIGGSGSDAHVVAGNTIGRDVTAAAALPNEDGGVGLYGGTLGNRIGGTGAGDSNIIASNGGDGISVFDNATALNTFAGNSIFDNEFRGIALYNSSNQSQAAPSLTSAVLGTGLVIQGSLTSTPNATFRVEFFGVPVADASGQGEGRTFLGATSVTTSGAGTAAINFTSGVMVPAGQVVAATATNAAGSTSQFSTTRAVTTTDTDGDGLPNAYETANGLSTSVQDADVDHDGDGQTTGAEFIAGTDPRNPASRVTLTAVEVPGADFAVDLATVTGRVYRIEKRSGFGAGTVWLPWVDQVPGTGAVLRFTDPGVQADGAAFYRGSALR